MNWSAVGTGMNNRVNALAVYNGELYAGGRFTTADGNQANHIAKWNGTNWTSLGLGTDTTVNALKVFNGDLIVGGEFTNAGGNPANYIAKWNKIVGVNEHQKSVISIYPSPAHQSLYISMNDYSVQNLKILLINTLGETILVEENKLQLDVSTIKDGVYYLQIKNASGLITKKIVIQH